MSTLIERNEKRCLNCNSLIYGRYCQLCGQENVQHKMTFFGMIKHFVFDLLHFDGKFFLTIYTLFQKPGLVPLEYVQGKRVKYLEPFRMYMFTSTVFFILYFTFFQHQSEIVKFNSKNNESTIINNINGYKVDSFPDYASFLQYNQTKIPDFKISFINQLIIKKYFSYPPQIRVDAKNIGKLISNDIIHKTPQIIFCILPFFVGLLKLLHYRNKNLAYSDHGIFSLYMFSLTFGFILFANIFIKVMDKLHFENIIQGVNTIFFIIYNVIFYLALKKFYRQSWSKTFFKFLLLSILNFVVASIIFILFVIISTLFF